MLKQTILAATAVAAMTTGAMAQSATWADGTITIDGIVFDSCTPMVASPSGGTNSDFYRADNGRARGLNDFRGTLCDESSAHQSADNINTLVGSFGVAATYVPAEGYEADGTMTPTGPITANLIQGQSDSLLSQAGQERGYGQTEYVVTNSIPEEERANVVYEYNGMTFDYTTEQIGANPAVGDYSFLPDDRGFISILVVTEISVNNPNHPNYVDPNAAPPAPTVTLPTSISLPAGATSGQTLATFQADSRTHGICPNNEWTLGGVLNFVGTDGATYATQQLVCNNFELSIANIDGIPSISDWTEAQVGTPASGTLFVHAGVEAAGEEALIYVTRSEAQFTDSNGGVHTSQAARDAAQAEINRLNPSDDYNAALTEFNDLPYQSLIAFNNFVAGRVVVRTGGHPRVDALQVYTEEVYARLARELGFPFRGRSTQVITFDDNYNPTGPASNARRDRLVAECKVANDARKAVIIQWSHPDAPIGNQYAALNQAQYDEVVNACN